MSQPREANNNDQSQSDIDSYSYGSHNSMSSGKIIQSAKEKKLEDTFEQVWEDNNKTVDDGVSKDEALRIVMEVFQIMEIKKNFRPAEWDALFKCWDSSGKGELSKSDLEIQIKVMIN